jgi:hypothetical protein
MSNASNLALGLVLAECRGQRSSGAAENGVLIMGVISPGAVLQ